LNCIAALMSSVVSVITLDYAVAMRYLVIFFCLFLCTGIHAETIYRSVDKDGNTVFSDTPTEGAEEMQIQNIQTITLPPVETTSSPTPVDSTETSVYESIAITSPANDEAIRNNEGIINVSISIQPALQANHILTLYLDGEEIQSSASPSFSLENVSRGSHQLRASVKDQAGRLKLSSPSTSFHMLRYSAPRNTPGNN